MSKYSLLFWLTTVLHGGGVLPQLALAAAHQSHQLSRPLSSNQQRSTPRIVATTSVRGRGLLQLNDQSDEQILFRRQHRRVQTMGMMGCGTYCDGGSGGGGGGPPSNAGGGGGQQGPDTGNNAVGGDGTGGTPNNGPGIVSTETAAPTDGQDAGGAPTTLSQQPANTTTTTTSNATQGNTGDNSGESMQIQSQACQSAAEGTPFKTKWPIAVPYQYQVITNGTALQAGFQIESVVDQYLVHHLILKNCQRRLNKQTTTGTESTLKQVCGVAPEYTVVDKSTPCQGVIVQAANLCHRLKASVLLYLCNQPSTTTFDSAAFQNQISQQIANGYTNGEYSMPRNGTILGLQVLAVMTNSSSNSTSANTGDAAAGKGGAANSLVNQPSSKANSNPSNDRSMSTAGIFFLTISLLAVVSGGAYFAVRELQHRRAISRGFRMEDKPRGGLGVEQVNDVDGTPRKSRIRSTILTNDTLDTMSSASQYGTEAILADLRSGGGGSRSSSTTITSVPRTRRTFGEDDESFSTSTSDAGGRGLYPLDERNESFGYRVRIIPESEVDATSMHPDDDTYRSARSYKCPNTVQL